MGNFMIASYFIILLNIMMWFGQLAMTDMNAQTPTVYTLDGSIIGNELTRQNGIYNNSIVNNSVLDDLPPSTASTVSPSSSGGFVTDLFNNILGYIKQIPGLNYIVGVVAAPYNILKAMNLPWEFTAAIGTLWYMLSLFALLSFLWWRD